jgi:hypothetical protein
MAQNSNNDTELLISIINDSEEVIDALTKDISILKVAYDRHYIADRISRYGDAFIQSGVQVKARMKKLIDDNKDFNEDTLKKHGLTGPELSLKTYFFRYRKEKFDESRKLLQEAQQRGKEEETSQNLKEVARDYIRHSVKILDIIGIIMGSVPGGEFVKEFVEIGKIIIEITHRYNKLEG